MDYGAELSFFRKLLGKFRLQSFVLDPKDALPEQFNMGLRRFFDWDKSYDGVFGTVMCHAEERMIYLVSDGLRCRYALLKLPDAEPRVLVIGPYCAEKFTEQELAAIAARFSLSAERAVQLRRLLAEVPVLAEESVLLRTLQTLCEAIWGDEPVGIMDSAREFAGVFALTKEKEESTENEQLLLNMELMENRYANENELMRIVSNGMVLQADQMMLNLSGFHFEQRSGDPLQSLKHYCIVCNTLLRKAAEQGGVHPLYIDRISSDLAWKIESVRSISEGETLIGDMVRAYSRLVRKHTTAGYSGLVQKVVTYIDADLAGDLTLHTVAAAQKVTASYLSAQFRKETGQTLTDFVNEKRVRHAIHLLQSTRLQVQAVAQRCGFQDPNYFVRLFKKKTGVTPAQYRRHTGTERTELKK